MIHSLQPNYQENRISLCKQDNIFWHNLKRNNVLSNKENKNQLLNINKRKLKSKNNILLQLLNNKYKKTIENLVKFNKGKNKTLKI
jgi:hypothetical protein